MRNGRHHESDNCRTRESFDNSHRTRPHSRHGAGGPIAGRCTDRIRWPGPGPPDTNTSSGRGSRVGTGQHHPWEINGTRQLRKTLSTNLTTSTARIPPTKESSRVRDVFTELQNRLQQFGDLCTHSLEEVRVPAHRIRDVGYPPGGESGPHGRHLRHARQSVIRCQESRLPKTESHPKPLRCKRKHLVPLRSRHGQDQVGAGRDLRAEAARSKV